MQPPQETDSASGRRTTLWQWRVWQNDQNTQGCESIADADEGDGTPTPPARRRSGRRRGRGGWTAHHLKRRRPVFGPRPHHDDERRNGVADRAHAGPGGLWRLERRLLVCRPIRGADRPWPDNGRHATDGDRARTRVRMARRTGKRPSRAVVAGDGGMRRFDTAVLDRHRRQPLGCVDPDDHDRLLWSNNLDGRLSIALARRFGALVHGPAGHPVACRGRGAGREQRVGGGLRDRLYGLGRLHRAPTGPHHAPPRSHRLESGQASMATVAARCDSAGHRFDLHNRLLPGGLCPVAADLRRARSGHLRRRLQLLGATRLSAGRRDVFVLPGAVSRTPKRPAAG